MKLKSKTVIIIAIVAVIACVICGVIMLTGNPVKAISEALFEETGIEILGIEKYSGAFFEDGSDEEVSDVVKLTVCNKGETDYQLLQLCITDKKGNEYRFKLTTLLKGETMVVLEENRAKYADMSKLESVTVEANAEFDTEPSIHSDVLTYMINGNNITVVNNSDKDITNLSVFYKNYSDGVAIGGITYMLTIPELPAGESEEISTAHYNEETGRFVFAVYG